MSANNYKKISNHIERIQSQNNFDSTVKRYVELMKQNKLSKIIDMNMYITNNNLWTEFSEIQRLNTFESGFKSIGVSKDAYLAIIKLYETADVIKSHLVNSTKMYQKTINFDDWEYR